MKNHDNILDEIYKLESRLNKYHDSDAGVSFDGLDDSAFDLNRYIQINFTRGRKENLQVDYEKINKTLTYYHDIQKTTCEEIVFSIDQNFEKYIGISTKFEGLKDRLSQTQEHFHHFNQLIEEYFTNNTQDLNKLKEVLSTYEQVLKFEVDYKIIEDILQLIEECEKLKKAIDEGNSVFVFEDLRKATYLIKIAQERYESINNKQSITSDLESKFRINECLKAAREDLLQTVEKSFKEILEELKDNKIDLTERRSLKKVKACLEGFSNLKSSDSIQKCLEQIIVTPALDGFVEKMNEEKSQPAVSPKHELFRKASWDSKPPSGIRGFYQNVLGMLETGPLLSLRKLGLEGSQDLIDVKSIEGYNIILSVWKSVFNILQSRSFIFLFNIGVADNFNHHYKETIRFLNSLANLFETDKERKEFWSHETMKRFLTKWNSNTSTYFQLRFVELIREYGKFLNEESLKFYVSEKRSISPLKETKMVNDYFEKCFSQRIFNMHLSTKFLKLAFQMVVMYCTSLEEFYFKFYKNEDYTENKINLLKNIINELYSVSDYCGGQLVHMIDEAFHQDITIMNSSAQIPEEKNREFVQYFTVRLAETIKVFEEEVAKYLIGRCEANLEFVNGIPKKFRMSTTIKGKPTEPSNFLDNIFLPLGNFFQNYNFQDIPQKKIEGVVVNVVYREFVNRAHKLVESSQKEWETLSRYRNANLGDGVSDFEKIKHQFYLDNRHIAEIVNRTVGIALENYSDTLFE